MNFKDFESIMESFGINSLAEIARKLNTTPQAVSNWKARNQIPYHIVSSLNQLLYNIENSNNVSGVPQVMIPNKQIQNRNIYHNKEITFSDILLMLAQQLKIIIIIPFIAIFLTFSYVIFVQKPYFISSSKILLPSNKQSSAGLAGLASQFGVNMTPGTVADLSSASLIPELIKSYTFAERILFEKFYVKKYDKEISLMSILNNTESELIGDKNLLIQSAISNLNEMITLTNDDKFSLLRVKAMEPVLARDINLKALERLTELNLYYKNQNLTQRIDFINNRINFVEKDLKLSEQELKQFRERNRQISSPSLQLEMERISREVEIQKGIFLTLKQQLELANIEKIQDQSVIQILDKPQIPLKGSGKDVIFSLSFAGILSIGFSLLIALMRSYWNQDNIEEKRKLQKVKNFLQDKSSEIINDPKISGALFLAFFIVSPLYLSHKSENPILLGMYSYRLFLINVFYILITLALFFLFIKNYKKRNKKKTS